MDSYQIKRVALLGLHFLTISCALLTNRSFTVCLTMMLCLTFPFGFFTPLVSCQPILSRSRNVLNILESDLKGKDIDINVLINFFHYKIYMFICLNLNIIVL